VLAEVFDEIGVDQTRLATANPFDSVPQLSSAVMKMDTLVPRILKQRSPKQEQEEQEAAKEEQSESLVYAQNHKDHFGIARQWGQPKELVEVVPLKGSPVDLCSLFHSVPRLSVEDPMHELFATYKVFFSSSLTLRLENPAFS